MDQRCGSRRPVEAQVVVDCRPAGLVRGKITNISVSGIFVRMPQVTYMTDVRVPVVFVRKEDGISKLYRMHAVIMRWTRDGAGLMFTDLSPNAFYGLLAILLADEQRARSGGNRVGSRRLSKSSQLNS